MPVQSKRHRVTYTRGRATSGTTQLGPRICWAMHSTAHHSIAHAHSDGSPGEHVDAHDLALAQPALPAVLRRGVSPRHGALQRPPASLPTRMRRLVSQKQAWAPALFEPALGNEEMLG